LKSEDTKQLLENVIAIGQASSEDSGRKYHLSASLSLTNKDLLKRKQTGYKTHQQTR